MPIIFTELLPLYAQYYCIKQKKVTLENLFKAIPQNNMTSIFINKLRVNNPRKNYILLVLTLKEYVFLD